MLEVALYFLTLPAAPFFWLAAWLENGQIAYVALAIYLTLIPGGLLPALLYGRVNHYYQHKVTKNIS